MLSRGFSVTCGLHEVTSISAQNGDKHLAHEVNNWNIGDVMLVLVVFNVIFFQNFHANKSENRNILIFT